MELLSKVFNDTTFSGSVFGQSYRNIICRTDVREAWTWTGVMFYKDAEIFDCLSRITIEVLFQKFPTLKSLQMFVVPGNKGTVQRFGEVHERTFLCWELD